MGDPILEYIISDFKALTPLCLHSTLFFPHPLRPFYPPPPSSTSFLSSTPLLGLLSTPSPFSPHLSSAYLSSTPYLSLLLISSYLLLISPLLITPFLLISSLFISPYLSPSLLITAPSLSLLHPLFSSSLSPFGSSIGLYSFVSSIHAVTCRTLTSSPL